MGAPGDHSAPILVVYCVSYHESCASGGLQRPSPQHCWCLSTPSQRIQRIRVRFSFFSARVGGKSTVKLHERLLLNCSPEDAPMRSASLLVLVCWCLVLLAVVALGCRAGKATPAAIPGPATKISSPRAIATVQQEVSALPVMLPMQGGGAALVRICASRFNR